MKKFLLLSITVLLLAVLAAGCSRSEKKAESVPEPTPSVSSLPEETSAPPSEAIRETSMPESASVPEPESRVEESEITAENEEAETADEEQVILEQLIAATQNVESFRNTVDTLHNFGIELDIAARDGEVAADCTLTAVTFDDSLNESIRSTIRKAAESQLTGMQPTFDSMLGQMVLAGIEEPVIHCRILDKNENLILEKDLTL